MALVTVSESSGDFAPIIKYDTRAGRVFRVDKDQNGSTPVDITRAFKALFDFEQVEIGHILFSAGGAPDFRMVPYGQAMPPKPAVGDYKIGIRMHVKLAPTCGGDVRELAGTARAFLSGLNDVHNEYEKLAPANPGKLPIVTLQDTLAVESGSGAKKSTNYRPVFSIVGWAPRPADMPLVTKAAGNGAARPAATNHAASNDEMVKVNVPPHVAATATADDFG